MIGRWNVRRIKELASAMNSGHHDATLAAPFDPLRK
jgi:hypothetical protein